MFKNLFRSNKTTEYKRVVSPKAPATESCYLSFLGLRINLTNPSWKTIILVIVFLIAVVLIIILLRDYVNQFKTVSSVKRLFSYILQTSHRFLSSWK